MRRFNPEYSPQTVRYYEEFNLKINFLPAFKIHMRDAPDPYDSNSEPTNLSECVINIEPEIYSISSQFYQSIDIVLDTNILIEVHQLEKFVKKYPFCTYVFPRVVMTELTQPNGKAQITFESGRIKFNNAHLQRIFGERTIAHQTTECMKRMSRLVGPNENNDKDYNDTLIGYFCKECQEDVPEITVYLLTRDAKFIKRCEELGVTAGYFDVISKIISEQHASHCIKKLDIWNEYMSFSCSEDIIGVPMIPPLM